MLEQFCHSSTARTTYLRFDGSVCARCTLYSHDVAFLVFVGKLSLAPAIFVQR